ncbi:MAG: helix-turn-helix domain-containing protein [Lentisphaeria bacterium]|nr:helix-turn-helix domain-containing protein [Lentisphaeria bacterium]
MQRLKFDNIAHIDRFKLTVKRMKAGKNRNMNFHDHDFSEIVVITEGSDSLHWCNGKAAKIFPGDVMLLHPGIIHAYENTENLGLVNIIFDASSLPLPQLDGGNLKVFQYLVDKHYQSPTPEKPLLHLDEKALQRVNSTILSMEHEIQFGLPGNRLCVYGLFLTVLTLIARGGGNESKEHFEISATKALHYLNLHFKEDISVDFLVRLCHMSRTGFFTAFKSLTGYTPIEYQQEKRLALAVELLCNTDKSLGEIASECGFCDSNYLSKLFTRKFGVSPGKMRKKYSGTAVGHI